MNTIIIYYKYTFIEYPQQLQKWQQRMCEKLGLKGRIIIAHEGINGTLGGSNQAIEEYITYMRTQPHFADIDFKKSAGGADCFPRLQIKVKNEIVRLDLPTQDVNAQESGTHLTPEQTNNLLQNNPQNLLIFDARNQYESAIGAFEGAVKPPITRFRELPQFIDDNLELFKDKEVLMYCTAGIRCEKASAYLKSKGVAQQVYQMQGGIHKYVEQYPNGFFKGKNYLFDARLSQKVDETVLAHCFICAQPSDTYANCLNASCNRHFICCTQCLKTLKNTCSSSCFDYIYLHNGQQRPPFVTVNSSQ